MKKLIKPILFGGLCFLMGAVAYRYKHKILGDGKESAQVELPASINFSDIQFDTVRIQIPDSAMAILQGNRAEAIKRGFLSKDYRDKVKATWVSTEDTFKIDLRLKGDLAEHWSHENRWSFRIKIKQGKAYKGIKHFNFQRPESRGNLNEWYYHKLLENHDLVNLRYKFVKGFINGVDVGIYAIEEYFDKRLIENNQHRVGVTFKFNTSKYWHHKHGTNPNRFTGSPIEPFKIGDQIPENPLYQQFLIAKGLIEQLYKKEQKLENVFDLKKLAKYMAIVDLTGHQHSSALDNMKFFYNPVTSLIEPIGYDNSVIKDLSRESIVRERTLLGEKREIIEEGSNFSSWYDLIFTNRAFYSEYIQALNSVSEEEQLSTFHEVLEKKIRINEYLIKHNLPDYAFQGDQIIKSNAAFIRGFLSPVEGVESFLKSKDTISGQVELLVSNQHYTPFELLSVNYKDSVLHQFQPNLLQAYSNNGSSSKEVSVTLPVELVKKKKFNKRLNIRYKILGADQEFESKAFPWDANNYNSVVDILESREPNFNDFEFAISTASEVIIPKGHWVLEKLMVIDAQHKLLVEPGTTIELRKDAAILSYGGVSFNGNAQEPVSVYSNDGGQGLLVINSPNRSSLSFTRFHGLSNFQLDHWKLPSAVTFYQSNVDIDYTSFVDNKRGDDYLNIFRSEFTLSNSNFNKTNADAFDGDFVNGIISNVEFDSVGNDALDFSGSSLTIENVLIQNVEDKAISGGERSYLTCKEIEIKNCELAITSKDDSHVDISNSSLRNCKVAYVVFMKKPEYGPGYVNVINVSESEITTQYLLEENSFLHIDYNHLKSTHSNVKELLYGKEYGKSSR